MTIEDYVDDVYLYSGAADLIVTRAGATNLAEFAVQAKPALLYQALSWQEGISYRTPATWPTKKRQQS